MTGPDFRYEAGNPQSTVTSGAVQPAAGSYATPAAMVLGADHDPAPFDHAEADALTVTAATKLLSTAAQQQLVGWAGAKWDS